MKLIEENERFQEVMKQQQAELEKNRRYSHSSTQGRVSLLEEIKPHPHSSSQMKSSTFVKSQTKRSVTPVQNLETELIEEGNKTNARKSAMVAPFTSQIGNKEPSHDVSTPSSSPKKRKPRKTKSQYPDRQVTSD